MTEGKHLILAGSFAFPKEQQLWKEKTILSPDSSVILAQSCAGDVISRARRAPWTPLPSAFTREGSAPRSQLGERFVLVFSPAFGWDFHAVAEVSQWDKSSGSCRLWTVPGRAARGAFSSFPGTRPHTRAAPARLPLRGPARPGAPGSEQRLWGREHSCDRSAALSALKLFPLAYRHTVFKR